LNHRNAASLLDTRLLRCFLAVLEHQNVTLASEVLCITQSATSKSILKLEEDLGVPLFNRTASGMQPTIYGLTLAKYAHQIGIASRRAQEEIETIRHGGFGTLAVGAGPMWSVYLLPDAIRALHHKRPGVRIHTIAGVIDTMVPQLLKGQFDIICASLDFPEHDEIAREPLFDVEYVILASRDHPLCKMDKVLPSDLLGYPWAGLAEDHVPARRVAQFFAAHDMPAPTPTIEASSLGALLSIIRGSDFIAGVSSTIEAHAAQLGLARVPIKASFWRFKAGVAYRRDCKQPMVQELIAELRNTMQSLAPSAPLTQAR
jgi:DNA-binding transcriptional LysR family regulator